MNFDLAKIGIELTTAVQDVITLISLYHYEEKDKVTRLYMSCIVYDLDFIQKMLPQTMPFDYDPPKYTMSEIFPFLEFETRLANVTKIINGVCFTLNKMEERDSFECRLYERLDKQMSQVINDYGVFYNYYEKIKA